MSITVGIIIRSIPYVCIIAAAVCAVLILALVYYSYRGVKVGVVYNHPLYVPVTYNYEDIEEIKQWIYENINGRVCVEIDILSETDWSMTTGQGRETLMGWTVRFTQESDAMAFKLVWITKNG